MLAATGEIVAYTDDDARPDPHWLYYLAHSFKKYGFAGVGGPNLAPAGDGLIADCVANAPGGPAHVLLSDRIAEHIPGCNMAFRHDVLQQVGGCDPLFRVAGDDVDLCWRVQQAGGTIGFHPAALVWHHRRNFLKNYWRQQQGYGKAEALLEGKWPEKYNSAGHLTARDVSRTIPEGETFILVDEQGFGLDFARGRRMFPFHERGGVYWGAPADGATAVRELEWMRREHGAGF